MKKNQKLVAVLSAATLLAMGASMSSFAAGWHQNDNSSWSYYDSDDDIVTGEWKKDGNKWYYLDDDGIMLTNSWVDSEQYVGEDGVMLTSQWKKTYIDDDINDPENSEENWYYFNSKGKKITGNEKIGDKQYYFNDEGKMQTGWQRNDEDLYYYGEEDDGARVSGWFWLSRQCTDSTVGELDDCEICKEEGWYYFGKDGKLFMDAQKKIKGRSYEFGLHGQMLSEWSNDLLSSDEWRFNAIPDGSDLVNADPNNAEKMIYSNEIEKGWRADGWYQIDGAIDTGAAGSTDWYYFEDGKAKRSEMIYENWSTYDKNGEPVFRKLIRIEGKSFCFNELGQMQTGLQILFDENDPMRYQSYYFDSNGYMKTGKITNVEEDEGTGTYYFSTKTGIGVTGEQNGYLYFCGKRVEADEDYKLYNVEGKIYLVDKNGKIQRSESKKYIIENSGFDGMECQIEMKSGSKYAISKVGDVSYYDADGEYMLDDEGDYYYVIEAVETPFIKLYGDTLAYYVFLNIDFSNRVQ